MERLRHRCSLLGLVRAPNQPTILIIASSIISRASPRAPLVHKNELSMKLAIIVFLPLIFAFMPALAIRAGKGVCALITAAISGSSLALLLSEAPGIYAGEVTRETMAWAPQLGLSFSFFVDGLGLFFAALILASAF